MRKIDNGWRLILGDNARRYMFDLHKYLRTFLKFNKCIYTTNKTIYMNVQQQKA